MFRMNVALRGIPSGVNPCVVCVCCGDNACVRWRAERSSPCLCEAPSDGL